MNKDNEGFEKLLLNLSDEEIKENERTYTESQDYRYLPFAQWPEFEPLWDLESRNQRFAIDADNEESFSERYPQGFLLGEVDLNDLLSNLAPGCGWVNDEIWTVGSNAKIAKVILFWKEKRKMTPPLICLSDNRLLIIGGGYNRIAVCMVKKIQRIPILVIPSEQKDIENKLETVRWT